MVFFRRFYLKIVAAFEYTGEQLNYNKSCYFVTDILTEGLRTIFKQEWGSRYKTTLREWKDQPSGMVSPLETGVETPSCYQPCKSAIELNGTVPYCFTLSFFQIASAVLVQ